MLDKSYFSIETAVANQSGAMETDTISKNGCSLKSKNLVMFILVFMLFSSYCYGQVQGQQQNNTVVIQNNTTPVVIEKPVYIERYRTVYVDKPQPQRVAKKLSAPVQLLGYLWVHTEDLGNFKQQPHSVITSVNAQSPHGRNDWRIPTPDELAVMENNADKIGLGDDIYMATDQSNGVLRLVSTGKTVAEKEKEAADFEQRRLEEEKRKPNSDDGIVIDGIRWATRNVGSSGTFVSSPQEYGNLYTRQEAPSVCPIGWRLPRDDEFYSLYHAGYDISATLSGVKGCFFGYNNNVIFLPAAGAVPSKETTIVERRETGYYWSQGDDWITVFYFIVRGVSGQGMYGTTKWAAVSKAPVRCVCDK